MNDTGPENGFIRAKDLRQSETRAGMVATFDLLAPNGTLAIANVSVLPTEIRNVRIEDECGFVGKLQTGAVLDRCIEAIASSNLIRNFSGGNLHAGLWCADDGTLKVQFLRQPRVPHELIDRRRTANTSAA